MHSWERTLKLTTRKEKNPTSQTKSKKKRSKILAVLKLQTAKPNLETQPLDPQTTFSDSLGVTLRILFWVKMDHIKFRKAIVYY